MKIVRRNSRGSARVDGDMISENCSKVGGIVGLEVLFQKEGRNGGAAHPVSMVATCAMRKTCDQSILPQSSML